LNYKGLKVGLEIHFQLDTPRKLFCHCPVGLVTDLSGKRIIRRLRPTQSELGQIDPAAYFEFQKGIVIEYIIPEKYVCLVELDEEPPHEICKEALAAAIAIANFLNSKVVDEFHVMRKVVIDGSNTTGFQRTLLVSLGGYITVNGKKIGIQTICLEEEAARLISREDNKVVYCLDRLGIPLIEIATAPDITSPDEAVAVAETLGRIVTATGMRRRGIGTIRQDINISVMGDRPVEVKGVQKLQQLKKVIEFEYMRQLSLLEIREELKRRRIKSDDIKVDYHDITDIFQDTTSKLIKKLVNKGLRVYALKLPGFKGLLSKETAPNYRLGKEMAERVRFWTGIGGLIHSDELPNYGIMAEDVDKIREVLKCGDLDAFVLIITDKHKAEIAMEKIVERAKEALEGIPKETRGAKEDGTTFYMRPRPGMARMYPETDIPPIKLSPDLINMAKSIKIVPPEETVKALIEKYGISKEQAWNIYDSGFVELFEKIARKIKKIKATYLATLLTDFPKLLEREGFEIQKLSNEVIEKTVMHIDNGVITKEVVLDLWKEFLQSQLPFEELVKKYMVESISEDEIKNYATSLIRGIEDFDKMPKEIKRKKLIGFIMSKYRGKVDPKVVVNIVDKLIS